MPSPFTMRSPDHRRVRDYGIALVAVALAFVLRSALVRVLHAEQGWNTFILATLATSALVGVGPGIVALVLGLFGGAYFAYGTIGFATVDDHTRTVLYLLIGSSIIAVTAALRRARGRADELRRVVDRGHALARDAEGRITWWSAGAAALYGYTAAEVLGRVTHEILQTVFPEPLRDIERHVREHGEWQGRLRHVRKDGTPVWVASHWTLTHVVDAKTASILEVNNDVTAQVEVEERYRHARAAAEEANRAKDEFLAMLSHELRNPLAPIRNAVEVLRSTPPDDPTCERARDIIDRQVQHLTRLVDDLLEVSRITRGTIALQRTRVTLADIVEQALETTHPLIEEHQHTLSVTLPTLPVHVEVDRARLIQVVANLLANAAKFTPRGGHITLQAERTDDTAVIRVRDTGVGIPAASHARIFDLFVQEETTLARSQGGLGIGLTLVRRLVELHGGRVDVQSDGRNSGATFTVTLPALPADMREAPGDDGVRTRSARQPLRILIVEDNPDGAESFQMLLELAGHDARVAHHALDALQMIDEFVPDVAFVDIGLPEIDGFELAKRLRADQRTRDVPLVAVTGYGREEDKEQVRRAGFDRHLTKPVDPQVVMALLAALGGVAIDAAEPASKLLH